MSSKRFENEKSDVEEVEQAKESEHRGSILSSIGTFINNTKRGSIFQLDGKKGSIFQSEGRRGSLLKDVLDGERRGSLVQADGERRGSLLNHVLDGERRGSLFQRDGERRGSLRLGFPFQIQDGGERRGSLGRFKSQDSYDGAKRGSIFHLFDDLYGEDEPRVLRLPEPRDEPLEDQADKDEKKSVNFKELTEKETQLLRKRLLYKGEYRVLNLSVLFILSMIVFGIVFMSAWHYNNQNFWVLYLVLGLILGAVGCNLALVKLYFRYKRYHGSNPDKKGVPDMIIENLGFKADESDEEAGQKAIEIVLKNVEQQGV